MTCTAISEFWRKVQRAVAARRPADVADLVGFPLRINDGGVGVPDDISSKEQFVKLYNRVITPRVARLIRTADPEKRFCNYQGLMLGRGVVWAWYGYSDTPPRITAINMTAPDS
jgi:hypothetical protein